MRTVGDQCLVKDGARACGCHLALLICAVIVCDAPFDFTAKNHWPDADCFQEPGDDRLGRAWWASAFTCRTPGDSLAHTLRGKVLDTGSLRPQILDMSTTPKATAPPPALNDRAAEDLRYIRS